MEVVKMRSSLLSAVRQITSSRQSPNRSADKTGVDLVPLFRTQLSLAASSRLSVVLFSYSHLSILVPFRISLNTSPSHKTPKFTAGVLSEILFPLLSNIPVMPAPATQHS